MSGLQYAVVWRDKVTGKDYLPVDSEYFEHNEQSAKEAGRDLLPVLQGTNLIPHGIMPISAADAEKLMLAPSVSIGSPGVEFVELGRAKT